VVNSATPLTADINHSYDYSERMEINRLHFGYFSLTNHRGTIDPQIVTYYFALAQNVQTRRNRGGSLSIYEAIRSCPVCSHDLPLRIPAANETGIDWLCVACGSHVYGLMREGCSDQERRNARPARMHFDKQAVAPVPEGRADTISRVILGRYEGEERRKEPRVAVSVPALAQPLDAHYRTTGDPFMGTTLNVSQGGLALLHTRHVPQPYMAIEFTLPGQQLRQAVLRVLRSRCIGLFYEIAGSFETKMGLDENSGDAG